ncbi:hypothetical protein [Pseudoalteromonas pernae]|uniref:hypothetical protein n=1 Tax=Pseudoalteromonas pernae TaxID=3118054 RepID=UPI003F7EBBFD
MMDLIVALSSIILVVVVVTYLYIFQDLMKQLREKYNADYERIERPTLLWNSTPRNNILFFKYLYNKEYKKHNDEELTEACQALLILLVTASIFLTLNIVFFIINVATIN